MKLGASCCVRFVAIFFIVLGFVVLLLAGLLSDPTGQQIALRSLTSLPPFLTDKLTKFGVLNVVQGASWSAVPCDTNEAAAVAERRARIPGLGPATNVSSQAEKRLMLRIQCQK